MTNGIGGPFIEFIHAILIHLVLHIFPFRHDFVDAAAAVADVVACIRVLVRQFVLDTSY